MQVIDRRFETEKQAGYFGLTAEFSIVETDLLRSALEQYRESLEDDPEGFASEIEILRGMLKEF